MRSINKYWMVFCLTLGVALAPSGVAHAQAVAGDSSSAPSDSHAHVYHVNYWVTGGIIVGCATAGILSIHDLYSKPDITPSEFAVVNPNNVPSFDRWSLHQDPSVVSTYEGYSKILQYGMGALPFTLLFDNSIRQDGLDVILMAMEVNAVAIGFYVSPLGPQFVTRYRPIVYYPDSLVNNRKDGNNKNSFYSGHVASALTASWQKYIAITILTRTNTSCSGSGLFQV